VLDHFLLVVLVLDLEAHLRDAEAVNLLFIEEHAVVRIGQDFAEAAQVHHPRTRPRKLIFEGFAEARHVPVPVEAARASLEAVATDESGIFILSFEIPEARYVDSVRTSTDGVAIQDRKSTRLNSSHV